MSRGKKIAAFWQEVGNVLLTNAQQVIHWDWKWMAIIPILGLAWVPPMFGWTVAGALGLTTGQ